MQLTTEVFQRALPKQIRGRIDQQVMDKINTSFTDPTLRENYRDNLLSYTHVMKDGKFKIDQYLDAVKYIGFKLMGNSNIEAYTKTFPDRYAYYLSNNTTQKDIASYITSYNKNKLVNLIYEQTLIPFHVLNTDYRQQALNTQVELMIYAKSEKVRSDAANSVLTHTKPPEDTKIELEINVKEDKSLVDLRAETLRLVNISKRTIELGINTAEDVAHSSIIIDADVEDVEID